MTDAPELFDQIRAGKATPQDLEAALNAAFDAGHRNGCDQALVRDAIEPLNAAATLIERHGKGAVALKTAAAVRLLPVKRHLMS